ncbi:MAG: hypothetical protein Q4C00_01715, partial [Bacillota bacterium]|nr:hypothetical protein [Bacillota bacterium]
CDKNEEKTNCNFISDLPITYKERLTPSILKDIGENCFSIEEWQEAILYILKIEKKFNSVAEAQAFFIDVLN